MVTVALSPDQLRLVLDRLGVRPEVGSPLRGRWPAAFTSPTPVTTGSGDLGDGSTRSVLRTLGVFVPDAGGGPDRVNRVVAAALGVCLRPDEVLWLGRPGASVTLCRRGRRWTEYVARPDGGIALTFPLDRARLVLLATAGLSGDRPEPPSTGFALRAPIADALLLRTVVDAFTTGAESAAPDQGVEIARLGAMVGALVEVDRDEILGGTTIVTAIGARAGVDRLAREPAMLLAAVDRLVAAGHLESVPVPVPLADGGSGLTLSSVVRPTARTVAVLGAPRVAAVEVGRRVVHTERGGRRLAEHVLWIERRGERLFVTRVVPAPDGPDARRVRHHLEMVERTRAEVRSLVGVFLLGDVWRELAVG